jgi:FkbM family methyltransferase
MDIREFLKTIQINTLVEIGAHFGTDTQYFRKVLPHADIICFEPDPRNLQILEKQGIDKIATIYPYAVSNMNGSQTFYLSTGELGSRWMGPECDDYVHLLRENPWSCSSSLKKPTGHLTAHTWITFPTHINVDCIRLDDFEPTRDKIIDFMWIDVQGAEDLVFEGSKETLKRTRYVYTEYCNTELYENQLSIDKLLKMYGPDWSLVHDFNGDVLLKNNKFV